MRDVLREEKKFLLNQAEALKLRNYLSNVVHTDSHNGPDGYPVRSLYFDSLSNRDFQEKEDGLELRRKFRLRAYSPDADFALFEMKQKQGPYQRKRSLRLSRREAQALIEGDYSVPSTIIFFTSLPLILTLPSSSISAPGSFFTNSSSIAPSGVR